MKKLLLLLFIALLFSCEVQTVFITPPVTEDPPPIIDPSDNEIVLALYDGNQLKFYDGSEFSTAYTGKEIAYSKEKVISVNDELCYFDSYGNIGASYQLITTPDILLTINALENNSRAVVYQDEVWLLETIEPETANSLGGGLKPYTHIFKNNVEIAPWYTYQYEITEVFYFPSSGRIILKDSGNNLHNLTDTKIPFKIFPELFIYDLNNRTAYMNEKLISFQENYFYTSRWQKAGDLFYSNYGMTFSDTDGFIENATALQDFKSTTYPYVITSLPNAEKPSLHPAGQNYELSEWVAYFIESTSGHLIKYIPSIDRYEILPKIFQGTNVMSTGNVIAANLKPQWIDGEMYFHHEGSIKVYNPEIGSVDIFAVDQELWEW